jgi:acyl-CoA thioesterase-1
VRALLPVVLLASACSPCGRVADLPGADVLFLGDSLLAWNEGACHSVPAHTALNRGVGYDSVAVNGARVLGGDDEIPLQQTTGDYATVVIDGGANDLNRGCDCDQCDDLLDDLATVDGREGAMPDLVDAWLDRGSDVVLIGYYPLKDAAWYGFDRCDATITELDRRYAALAETRPAVTFFDFGDVIDPSDKGVYDFDFVHPSPKGARLIGEALAKVF